MCRNTKELMLTCLSQTCFDPPFPEMLQCFLFHWSFYFFPSCRCTSVKAFCYRSYYATEILGVISVSKQKNHNGSPTINQLTLYIRTSLCPICLCIVTSDLNLGLSLSVHSKLFEARIISCVWRR